MSPGAPGGRRTRARNGQYIARGARMRRRQSGGGGGFRAAVGVLVLLVSAALLGGCRAQPKEDPDLQRLRANFNSPDQAAFDRTIAAADQYLQHNPTGLGAAQALYLRGRSFEQRVKKDPAHSADD